MIGNFQSYPLLSLRIVASADLDIDVVDWSKLWLYEIDLVIQPVNWSISDAIKLPRYRLWLVIFSRILRFHSG